MDLDASFPLDINLGSLQIGFLVSAFLFGVLTVQALIYNRKFGDKDHWALKSLVAVIWLFELGQLSCVAHAFYIITITQSGNLLALLKPPRTIGGSFLLGSAVGPLVEVFYVSRLLRFSGQLYVALIGWFLALARFGGWVFLASRVIVMSSLTEWVDNYGWLFAMLLGLSAVVDLTISTWIAYFLARRKGRRGSRRDGQSESAKQLLDRVILWTLQTGVITSLSFLVTLICYLILGQYLIWLAVLAILTKVSSNCFLASLNARSSTRFRGRKSDQSYPPSRGTVTYPQVTRTAHSIVDNIIELYELPSTHDHDHEPDNSRDSSSDMHFHTIHRAGSRASHRSFGNADVSGTGEPYDRSAFSPDGTVISVASSRRSGYWAL